MKDQNQFVVFDRALLRQRRNRAAKRFDHHSVLHEECAERLVERLGDIRRDFSAVLALGFPARLLAKKISSKRVVAGDVADRMAQGADIVLDEEYFPFASDSFDLICSNLTLHNVNDLPGTLVQTRHILRHDGLFLAALFGGQTLRELRDCLLDAELTVSGGVSPRLSPLLDLQTASGLLQRAGFHLPVADAETIMLAFPDLVTLMRDLRGMGENNINLQRLKHPTARAVFVEAERLYRQRYAMDDGALAATFEVIFLHGWAPGGI